MVRRLTADDPDPIDLWVGQRLRARRKDLAISQRALAGALGLTFQQVQKYERGRNRVAASTLVRAAAHLETTVAALVGEREGRTESIVELLLKTAEALELLAAYAGIEEPDSRRLIVELTEALARAADRQRWTRLGRREHQS